MKKSIALIMAAVMLCSCCAAFADVLTGEGTIRRGMYVNGSFSCSVPVNFQVDDFDRDAQRVKLNGPADANGFFPHLLLTVLDSPYDLSDCSESRELRAVKDYDGYRNTLCVLDEDCSLYGKEAHRLMILYNTSDERMNIWYSIYTNVEGYGVNIVYTAYSATRTIPGDLEEVDRIVKNIAF